MRPIYLRANSASLSLCSYAIVFISNQAGNPAQQRKFREKLPLVGAKLGESVPFHVFAAWSKEAEYRKPGTGMWDAYVREFNDGKEVGELMRRRVGDAAAKAGS